MTDVYTELLQENSELKTEVFRLEQENKTLKNSLKDFQYSDEQHLLKVIELEKENRELKSLNKKICEDCTEEIKYYWNAFEDIKHCIMHIPPFDKQSAQMIEALLKLINEVLND